MTQPSGPDVRKRFAVATAAAGIALALTSSAVRGAVTPALTPGAFTYSGAVLDSLGKPVASQTVTVAFYDAATSGNLVCSGQSSAQSDADGRFAIPLATACQAVIASTNALFVEVSLNGTPMATRSKVGSVPYAAASESAAKVIHAARAVSADTTMSSSDSFLAVTTGAANRTVTLPSIASMAGRQLTIKKVDADPHVVTIDASASELIESALTTTLNTQGETLTLLDDGTAWQVVARRIPSGWTSYTPALSSTTGLSSANGAWRRVGDSVEIRVQLKYTSAGDTTRFTVAIPNYAMWDIDTTKNAGGSDVDQILGVIDFSYTTNANTGSLIYNDVDSVAAARPGDPGRYTTSKNDASGTILELAFSVPIVGWNE